MTPEQQEAMFKPGFLHLHVIWRPDLPLVVKAIKDRKPGWEDAGELLYAGLKKLKTKSVLCMFCDCMIGNPLVAVIATPAEPGKEKLYGMCFFVCDHCTSYDGESTEQLAERACERMVQLGRGTFARIGKTSH